MKSTDAERRLNAVSFCLIYYFDSLAFVSITSMFTSSQRCPVIPFFLEYALPLFDF